MHYPVLATAAVASFAVATASMASTPEAWAKLDAASQTACLKASGLRDAQVGPSVRFSDNVMIDARVVDGFWPQPHMKGAKARMLCLYNRKTKRIEVQELAEPVVKVSLVKDIWWRADKIGGNNVIDGSEVTMMLGADGKIAGNSGCNGYSARYQITGDAIQLYPPMISTRMACAPAIMGQEQIYQKLIEGLTSIQRTPEGRLIVTSANGLTVTFVKK